MAASDDDLRINTLHALRKHSPTLVLEEHSHCEVPAGCGGVVLRWRDPAEGTPAVLSVVADGAVTALLDGEALASSWVSVRPGAHRLTIELRGLAAVPSPLLVVAGPAMDEEGAPLFRSTLDGGWRGGPLDAPDAALVPLVSADDLLAARVEDRRSGWRWQRLRDEGAHPLRIDWTDARVVFDFHHAGTP